VRSIYFDTPSLRYYHEKKAGILVRRKLRVRAYNEREPGDWVFLEIKRKVHDKISKNRAPIAPGNVGRLLKTGDVGELVFQTDHYPRARDDANRFMYHVCRYGLGPTFMTIYEREAFLGLGDPTLRITFDRNLRGRAYPPVSELYSEHDTRYVRPGFVIMEVKFNTRFPFWLRSVLGRYGLRKEALSKYCMCGEITGRHVDSKISVLSRIKASA
ncbi:MAG: polyphosphate polymerase domain-containing protein, partial [Rhodothermia bacterium]|nr:polyphosphate polymerase domain-containing protein [Rhodothermia bacterium]